MRRWIGVCCMLLGVCCLIASAGLIFYNDWEEKNAEQASNSVLQDVRKSMADNAHEESSHGGIVTDGAAESEYVPEETPQEMPAARVEGYDCIGVLSIPVLELDLPVIADWSYAKLKIAPCRYYGSCYEKDFVIAAHNYRAHFGRLSALQPEDLILFTDISGTVYCYEVVLLETLPADATMEMITSGFDLSLYTCTTGGTSRVTVRCSAVKK